jgi:hypothetical protein
MPQVDDSDDATTAHQGHGEKCFATIFGQFVEELEAGIVRGFFRNRHASWC